MLRVLSRLFVVGIVLFAATVAGVTAYAQFAQEPDPSALKPTDVIVVLGAGMDPDGTLHRSSTLRVDRGVALWRAGLAPRLHFTGGMGRPGGPSAGERMAERAIAQGVPTEAVSWEGRSLSTLQNALFSQPMLAQAESLRLVTEGFHLPRAWASFAWAGDHTLHLSHSERLRSVTPSARFPQATMVVREALAIWFNLARALLHGVAGIVGVGDATRDAWLA